MADELVLATQQWLNKTYGTNPNFDKVPENGQTGWPTIYGLIEGLQVELGISNLVGNFGPTTELEYEAQITPNWGSNLSQNIVYLIQGAFWCKGINPGGFDGSFSSDLRTAVVNLKKQAGFESADDVLSAIWAKALFSMSAFVLVPDGDSTVRSMQQWLNVNYNAYFGIMPCDGIYQRDTNMALIYALQANEGLAPEDATGTYGNLTTQLTPTLVEGDSGEFVKILQYALYVNGFNENKVFSGIYTSYIGAEVHNFKEFMILPPYNDIANMPVMKGLLSSAGHTGRNATGADTSTQLTDAQIQTLGVNDVQIIGRYLTGTVGVGEDERDKFVTVNELNKLFDAGISVFPIFQDGGSYLEFFDYGQGFTDGRRAIEKLYELGVPEDVTVYFAVDYDATQDDINSNILPYFRGVNALLSESTYKVGVYGTRNTCNNVIGEGLAETAFVSDMSTGFSGNLGFAMPRKWAFDQFIEFSIGSGSGLVAIDNDAVSGRDTGFKSITPPNLITPEDVNDDLFAQISDIEKLLISLNYDGLTMLHQLSDFYRKDVYNSTSWEFTTGKINTQLMNVITEAVGPAVKYYVDRNSGTRVSVDHMFANLATHTGLLSSIRLITDATGWFGDLVSIWPPISSAIKFDPDLLVSNLTSGLIGMPQQGYSMPDVFADCDSINLINRFKVGNLSDFSSIFKTYINGSTISSRVNEMVSNRFTSFDNIENEVKSLIHDQNIILEVAVVDRLFASVGVERDDIEAHSLAFGGGYGNKLKRLV